MNLGMSLALGSALRSAGVPSYSPLSLFGGGEQGAWYDPSDFSTMYQDNLGVTPVTAVGQTVGRIEDKSGNGNHATQATAASRPILGRVPFGGRRNLLTYTEQFDNAVWTKTNATITANAATAPDGATTADKLVEDATTSRKRVVQVFSVTSGITYTQTIYAKAAERSSLYILFPATQFSSNRAAEFNLSSGTVAAVDGSAAASITDVGDGWYRCALAVPCTASGSASIEILLGTAGLSVTNPSYTGDGTSGILIWGAQLETGSTATDYQRVTTAFDVTQAGVAECYYLSFDGTDDFLLTSNIDFSATDEMTVVAGVRKLSDAAGGMIAGTSTSPVGVNGTFKLSAPEGDGVAQYWWRARGTASGNAILFNSVPAPDTGVLTGLADISTPVATLRTNGVQRATSATSLGTGNFTAAQPLYIGRRGGATQPFNGHLYSLIVRGLTTAGGILTDAESYVAGKTGVTL
jgi:hypothetical protein